MKIKLSNSGRVSNPFLDRITVLQGNITTQNVDAIAMVMTPKMEMSGALNAVISQAAGNDLDRFILDNIYKPRVGEVYAIPAFNLPCKHILLGVMPHIRTEFDMRDSDLSGMARRIMELARCMLLSRIAIPSFSMGKGEYPQAKAARLISLGITERLQENFEEVRIICAEKEVCDHFKRKLQVLGWNG